MGDDDAAVFDPRAGFLRTDRAVLSAVAAAESRGAEILTSTPVDELHEDAHGVRVVSGSSSWTFERVVVAAGGWSRHLLPASVADAVDPAADLPHLVRSRASPRSTRRTASRSSSGSRSG